MVAGVVDRGLDQRLVRTYLPAQDQTSRTAFDAAQSGVESGFDRQDGCNGETANIFGLVDHGNRALLSLVAAPNKCSWTLLGHLFLAIGKCGKPRAVRTDNEACFTSRLFRAALLLIGIRQQHFDPGCPWQNGRIERLFGTLKQKLDCLEVVSLDAL